MPYGSSSRPGTHGTFQRDVWWVLNRVARVGEATGKSLRKPAPPFRWQGILVTEGVPSKGYGLSSFPRSLLTHLTRTVLFAWRDGRVAGWSVVWWCGSRTAYFRFVDVPADDAELCMMCTLRLDRHERKALSV